MSVDDIADDHSLIFTEADVYMIAGYLAQIWGISCDVTEETERAITDCLAASE